MTREELYERLHGVILGTPPVEMLSTWTAISESERAHVLLDRLMPLIDAALEQSYRQGAARKFAADEHSMMSQWLDSQEG